MVILLSAFNGIEQMIENLYTDFDQEITITPKQGKTVDSESFQTLVGALDKIPEIQNQTFFIRERVLLKKNKKWVNAELWGVKKVFFEMANLNRPEHLVNGHLPNPSTLSAVMGIALAQKLELKSMHMNPEEVVMYIPKSNIKIKFGQNPFYQELVSISGVMDYNKEVNEGALVMDLEWAQNILNRERLVSGLLISTDPANRERVQSKVRNFIGSEFEVKTNLETNALIFKTSKTEKLIVAAILLFVFVLSLFNLVASLTMLHLEKQESIRVLFSMGINLQGLFNIYFFEGLLISALGVMLGLMLGGFLVFLQSSVPFIFIPLSQKPFPVQFSWSQVIAISAILFTLSWIVILITARFIINSIKSSEKV